MVTKLDRLGRSLAHLIELSHQLQAAEVDLVVLDQGIDTSTAIGRMFFQILGSIAEFEHALMPERAMDGLVAARAGRTGGQSQSGVRQARLAQRCMRPGELTVAQIAAEFGVTHPTIYRHLDDSTRQVAEPPTRCHPPAEAGVQALMAASTAAAPAPHHRDRGNPALVPATVGHQGEASQQVSAHPGRRGEVVCGGRA